MTTLGKSQGAPLTTCTGCGCRINAFAGIGSDERPDAGDVTVCMRCGHVMAYNADLTVREPTAAERTEFMRHPDVRKAVATVRKLNAKH